MQILVYMSDNRNLDQNIETANYNSLVAAINYEYCKKHNYDFIYYRPYLKNKETAEVYNCFDPNSNAKRHAAWSKLLSSSLAIETLYDYIVYIDSDCIFKDVKHSLEEFIKQNNRQQRDILFLNNKPWDYNMPCSGFYICKVNSRSRKFLKDWYNLSIPEKNTIRSWEQDALWRIFKNYDVEIVDSWMFREEQGQYLRHVSHCDLEARVPYFKKYIQQNNINFKSNISQIMVHQYDTMSINTITANPNRSTETSHIWADGKEEFLRFVESNKAYVKIDDYTFKAQLGEKTHTLIFNKEFTIFTSNTDKSPEIKPTGKLHKWLKGKQAFLALNKTYKKIDEQTFQIVFGEKKHTIVFNETFSEFISNVESPIFNKSNCITKVLFQTYKSSLEKYVVDMIKSYLGPDWKYEFYNDNDVIQFFISNPIADLPDIIKKYNSIEKGAHKADLFRYYYLYVNGGFFMDSDAMIYVDIETIVKNYNFVSVNSSCHPGTIFQGILGASPKNEIIKKALYKAYNTDPNILRNNYTLFCEQLYEIIKEDNNKYAIKLYEERRTDAETGDDIHDGDTLLFKHYWKNKVIPNYKNITNWNEYKLNELNDFDYRILNTYKIPNKLVRVGPNEDGGYVIADGFDYDLFISCGIANDIRFEEAFLEIHKIKCLAFDGTIPSFPPHSNSIEWVNKNIGHSNTQKTTNLKDYIKNNNRIFLKMDIEGSEFNWLDSMIETDLEKFSQIVIEVHWPFDIYRMNMLNKLNKTHYIIHLHGNNYCDKDIPKHLPSGRTYDGTVTINNNHIGSIILPEVFEITYINKNLCDNSLVEKAQIQFPTVLDYPNNTFAKDIRFSIPLP